MTNPFFLVGAERSGTTLLRLMLDHHPQIAWCEEFEYSVDRMGDQGEFPPLEEYTHCLSSDFIFQSSGFEIDPALSYPQLIKSFLDQRKKNRGKKIIGATVHRNFDRLLYIWPNAKFIHLIRDGREVARSCIRMGWAGNVWTGIRRWQNAEKLWGKLEAKLANDRKITIYYEDLICHPEKVLNQLCQFMGVEYHAAMLSYPDDTTYSSPDGEYIQQWRKNLSPSEVQLIEAQVGDQLEKLGYKLSGLPPKTLSSWEKKWLLLQDWWYRFNFRRKRYGNLLFMADFISRRFAAPLDRTAIEKRMFQIHVQHLK
jgi:hypothetical protein